MERYEPNDWGATDVRELLEHASDTLLHPPVDVDEQWARGRRRRIGKRAGAVLGLAAAAGVGLLVWQSGLMGGRASDPGIGPAGTPVPAPTTVSTTPAEITYVFAAPDAPDADPSTVSALRPATTEDLANTRWTLTEHSWGQEQTSSSVITTAPTTVLEFGGVAGRGWGVQVGDCPGQWFPQGVTLGEDGSFPAGAMTRRDVTCPEREQVPTDYWTRALEGGGQLQLLGDGSWLLVGISEAPDLPRETSTQKPDATSSTERPQATDRPTEVDRPFVPAGTELAWPDRGSWSMLRDGQGGLEVSGIRFGRHDGFDRMVLDLTGPDDVGWMVRYEDPAMGQAFGPIDLPGEGVLVVDLVGVAYPEDPSAAYEIPTGDPGATETMTELQIAGPYEGHLNLFLGTDRQRPFRAQLLGDPLRLVVDVQREG